MKVAEVARPEHLFEMANLFTEETGLPFVVWVSEKSNIPHDVRVKVAPTRNATNVWEAVVLVREPMEVVEGSISGPNLKLLRRWIRLNRNVIIDYWNGVIPSTKQMISMIKPIPVTKPSQRKRTPIKKK